MAGRVELALDTAERGYYVFPIAERGKTPLTRQGFKDATRDERQVLHLWDRTPGANIGIDLGRSGAFVVDIDPKYGADPEDIIDALGLNRDNLIMVHTGEAPEATDDLPKSLAGTRGMHLYFAGTHPTRATPIEGIEVRGVGGYVVAPGSVHASGVEYVGMLPPVADLLDPPPPILTLLRTSMQTHTVAPRVDGPIPQGNRNGTLASFAGSMRRRGMSETAILAALGAENARCEPPLPQAELEAIARSIARYAPSTPPSTNGGGAAAAPEAVAAVEPKPDALLMNIREAMKLAMQPIPWVIDSIAAQGAITTLAGVRGEAKTWLGMFMCAAAATGGAVAGIDTRKAVALYVDAENGPRTMGRRFLDIGLAHDAFLVADGGRLQLPRDLPKLRRLIETTGAKLVVLDSLRRLAPGAREDKSDDMAPIFAGLSIIARETDCALVVLHHRSVKFNAPDTRGSSAIEDQSDLIFVLERDHRDPQGKRRKRLRCTKSRIDAEPDTRWLRLDSMAGFITMAGAEPFVPEAEDEAPPILANTMAAIQGLADRVRQDGAWPPKRIAEAINADPKAGTFQRALAALVESGEWTMAGKTRARVYAPNDSRQPGGKAGGNPPPDPLFPDEHGDLDSRQLPPSDWERYDTGDDDGQEDDNDWRS